MPPKLTRWATAGKLLVTSLGLAGATARPAAAQTAYGLAPGLIGISIPALVTFDVTTGAIVTAHFIQSIPGGQKLAGLDVRPNTGELFALGYASATSQAQLYTLSPATGNATAIGPLLLLNLGTTGDRIGFDFDPTTDRIRVTSGTGTNYRLNPTTGALVATDGLLAYAAADPNAGQAPGVGAAAYLNSYPGSTSTMLYDIDEVAGRLLTQSPANSGTLNTVGPLGVNPTYGQVTDLDIYYNPTTHTNVAYFMSLTSSLSTGILSTLYTLNLTTGAATLIGPMRNTTGTYVTNIALAAPAAALATRPTELATELTIYPNPAATSLSLSFGLAHTAHAELVVTDLLGRPVDTLDAGWLPAGPQALRWQRGGQAAGLYLVQLRLDGLPAGTCQAVLTQ
ncbi:MAG: DUF4394 domain-containing protein [Janthinobacterium lividum]